MAGTFQITLIDVGWGDSIFLEHVDNANNRRFALIDSNDTENYRSTEIFLKRYFEIAGIDYLNHKPIFEFVMLSHAHNDHAKGLKRLMAYFGTRNFFYPKSNNWGSHAGLLNFANRSSNVEHHESVDTNKIMDKFGDVSIEVLWPPHDLFHKNENNNSIVLLCTHGSNKLILTGDAEEEVWHQIANRIPDDTGFFKIPHHGSVNGTFDPSDDSTPWFDHCPPSALLAISSHIRPHGHPHHKVIDLLESNNRTYLRTDVSYHIHVRSDGAQISTKYAR